MPKGDGSDGCPAFCPVTCAHQYATPCQDITDGCVVNEFCAYGSPSPIYQSEMCQAICPANCDPATEMECPGGYDHMGCEQPSSCVPIHDAAGGPSKTTKLNTFEMNIFHDFRFKNDLTPIFQCAKSFNSQEGPSAISSVIFFYSISLLLMSHS